MCNQFLKRERARGEREESCAQENEHTQEERSRETTEGMKRTDNKRRREGEEIQIKRNKTFCFLPFHAHLVHTSSKAKRRETERSTVYPWKRDWEMKKKRGTENFSLFFLCQFCSLSYKDSLLLKVIIITTLFCYSAVNMYWIILDVKCYYYTLTHACTRTHTHRNTHALSESEPFRSLVLF